MNLPRIAHRLLVSAVAAFAVLPLAAQERSSKPQPTKHFFLWKVEGEKPSYLYGTIHLPDPRILALPEEVKAAAEGCDVLLAEIPMEPAKLAKAATAVMLPEGKTLEDVLPEKLYERLSTYMESKGAPMLLYGRLKPWAVAAQLVLLDLGPRAARPPLDMVLYRDAKRAKKEVGGLETLEEQLGVFDSFTDEEQVTMLEETLDDLEEHAAEGKSFVEELIETYLSGDEERLVKLMHESLEDNDELRTKFMDRLLWQRNKRMVERIAAKLEANPDKSFFFAIGAAHFPLQEGIIALLRKRGIEAARLGAPAKKEAAGAGR